MSTAITFSVSRPLAFPRMYAAYLALGTLDVILTAHILSAGGRELNGIAAWAVEAAGVPGLAALKYISILVVVCICETVWHGHSDDRRHKMARKLVEWAVAISSIPVTVALIQIAAVAA